jgi:hypothetical protein
VAVSPVRRAVSWWSGRSYHERDLLATVVVLTTALVVLALAR